MAEHDLIDAHLATLRRSVSTMPNADDILDEAADHLLSAVEALTASGVHRTEAERIALARYGSARKVGRAFVEQAHRRGAVATEYTRAAGFHAIVAAVLGPLPYLAGDVYPTALAVLLFVGSAFGGAFSWILAVIGIRVRHGTLGPWGRRAIALALASPVAGFILQSMDAFFGVLLLAVASSGIGMVRARILPVPAVVLWLLPTAPLVFLQVERNAWAKHASRTAMAVGLAWIGWTLWREHAVDEQPAGPYEATVA